MFGKGLGWENKIYLFFISHKYKLLVYINSTEHLQPTNKIMLFRNLMHFHVLYHVDNTICTKLGRNTQSTKYMAIRQTEIFKF